MSTPAFITVTTAPQLTVYTTNVANVGAQTLDLVTQLENYPHISAKTTFVITIYNFKATKAITLQYYQITKPALALTWAAFTISPAPPVGDLLIHYIQPLVFDYYTGQPIIPLPIWLTTDTTLRTLKVFTNSFGDAGCYSIIIQGKVTNYDYTANQTVVVNITKTPPPVL